MKSKGSSSKSSQKSGTKSKKKVIEIEDESCPKVIYLYTPMTENNSPVQRSHGDKSRNRSQRIIHTLPIRAESEEDLVPKLKMVEIGSIDIPFPDLRNFISGNYTKDWKCFYPLKHSKQFICCPSKIIYVYSSFSPFNCVSQIPIEDHEDSLTFYEDASERLFVYGYSNKIISIYTKYEPLPGNVIYQKETSIKMPEE